MVELLKGFDPFIKEGVHTLIVGTFPGVESLGPSTYYGVTKRTIFGTLCIDAWILNGFPTNRLKGCPGRKNMSLS